MNILENQFVLVQYMWYVNMTGISHGISMFGVEFTFSLAYVNLQNSGVADEYSGNDSGFWI